MIADDSDGTKMEKNDETSKMGGGTFMFVETQMICNIIEKTSTMLHS